MVSLPRLPAFPRHSRNSIILSNYSPRAMSRAEVHHSAAVGSPDEDRQLRGRIMLSSSFSISYNTWREHVERRDRRQRDLSLSSLHLKHRLYLSSLCLSLSFPLSLPFLSFGNQQVERETGGLAMYAWCRVRYDNPELWPVSVMTTSWIDVSVR